MKYEAVSKAPPLEVQKKFWDWHWDNEVERRTANQWKDERHAKMVEYLKSLNLNNPRILDIGCGSGLYTADLADFGPTMGIDLSPVAIERAKQRSPGIDFRAANLYQLEIDEPFDVILAQEVFDHVENQPEFVEKCSSMLVEGGFLIISCVNRFVRHRLGRVEFSKQPDAHVEKALNMSEFKKLIARRFDVKKSTSLIPMGDAGILRFVNSYKVNSLLGSFVGKSGVTAIKEKAGLGLHNVLLAQKR